MSMIAVESGAIVISGDAVTSGVTVASKIVVTSEVLVISGAFVATTLAVISELVVEFWICVSSEDAKVLGKVVISDVFEASEVSLIPVLVVVVRIFVVLFENNWVPATVVASGAVVTIRFSRRVVGSLSSHVQCVRRWNNSTVDYSGGSIILFWSGQI